MERLIDLGDIVWILFIIGLGTTLGFIFNSENNIDVSEHYYGKLNHISFTEYYSDNHTVARIDKNKCVEIASANPDKDRYFLCEE